MNNGNFNEYQEVKRTYTPEEAGHDAHRKPVSRYSRRRLRRKKPNIGVLLVIFLFLVIFAVCLYFILSGGRDAKPDSGASVGSDTTLEEETTQDPAELLPYTVITLSEEDMYSGDLILVNSYTEYKFPETEESGICGIAANMNEYCNLSSNSNRVGKRTLDAFNRLTSDFYDYSGFRYLQINSAYRSYEEQVSIYDEYTEAYGAEYARAYVANPGFSEHHTGLAMDINVIVDGITYPVAEYEGAAWFKEHAEDYGFILRYPADKVEITGISHESWHYRYVGVPHSYIMTDMNLCLEEYETYIKQYTYENMVSYNEKTGPVQLGAEASGDNYAGGTAVYFVPSDGETTEVKIPKAAESYSVSGNNIDGYIITLH